MGKTQATNTQATCYFCNYHKANLGMELGRLEDFCEECGLAWWPAHPGMPKCEGVTPPTWAEWKAEQQRRYVAALKRVLLFLKMHRSVPNPAMVLVKDSLGLWKDWCLWNCFPPFCWNCIFIMNTEQITHESAYYLWQLPYTCLPLLSEVCCGFELNVGSV